jgi:EmrB/QacA subfamily drug resistance transporter
MSTKQKWVLLLTSISSLMVALDVTVVSTALSSMRVHLHATIEQLEWTINAYGLSFAVLLMTASALGDRFGRRRLYASGMALFVLASIGCALSPTVGWLIAARTIQGVGAAIVAPMSLSLLSEAFPPERRGTALGIFGGITGIAVIAGPVLGGAVTQGLAWQWIFWLNVPIGLAAIPLVLRRIDESYGPRVKMDLPGLGLVTLAAFGLVWGLVRGNTAGWGSAEVVATLGGGVVLAVAFVVWELRTAQPMLPMRLFTNRAFAFGNASMFLLMGSLFSAVFFMAQFQQAVLGASPLQAGIRMLPWTGTVFFITPISGALVDRIGERPLLTAGLLLQGIGFGVIALASSPHMSYGTFIAPMLAAGAGVSLALPAAQNAIFSAVGPDEIGTASGTMSTMRQLGGAFGLAIAVAAFTGAGDYASANAFSDGFVAAISVSAIVSFVGVLAALSLGGRRRVVESGAPVSAAQAVASS